MNDNNPTLKQVNVMQLSPVPTSEIRTRAVNC